MDAGSTRPRFILSTWLTTMRYSHVRKLLRHIRTHHALLDGTQSVLRHNCVPNRARKHRAQVGIGSLASGPRAPSGHLLLCELSSSWVGVKKLSMTKSAISRPNR